MQGKDSRLALFLLCLIMTVGTGCIKQLATNQDMTTQSRSSMEEQKLKEEPARKKALDEQTVRKDNLKRGRTQLSATGSVSMPVYLIAQLNIRDRSRYSQYVAGFMDILSRSGGRLLSVDESPELFEGEWDFTRTVLIEFPSEAEAKSWYYSEDYQRLAQHRLASSDANVVLIKGR